MHSHSHSHLHIHSHTRARILCVQYEKTTLSGLARHSPDHICIVVSATGAVTQQTRVRDDGCKQHSTHVAGQMPCLSAAFALFSLTRTERDTETQRQRHRYREMLTYSH